MLSDLSEKELNSAVEVYRHAYGDTISEAEAFEEMCCDALGKINIFAGTEHDSTNYGKVQESFRKHTAESSSKGRAPPKSGVKFSKEYWRPQLSKKEWELLNYSLDRELGTPDNYLNKSTKWLYKDSKGTKVFAIYGIGDGTEATVLYAVGGKKANDKFNKLQKVRENFERGIDNDGETPTRWLQGVWSERGNGGANVRDAGRRGARSRDGRLHDGASKGNRGGVGGGSVQNSRTTVKKKFSMEAPIEEKKNLIALHNLDKTKLLKTLYIVTAFIGEKGYKNGDTRSFDDKIPEVTPKSATASSPNTNIPTSSENVNKHYADL